MRRGVRGVLIAAAGAIALAATGEACAQAPTATIRTR
jgi:hypothetical protein